MHHRKAKSQIPRCQRHFRRARPGIFPCPAQTRLLWFSHFCLSERNGAKPEPPRSQPGKKLSRLWKVSGKSSSYRSFLSSTDRLGDRAARQISTCQHASRRAKNSEGEDLFDDAHR